MIKSMQSVLLQFLDINPSLIFDLQCLIAKYLGGKSLRALPFNGDKN